MNDTLPPTTHLTAHLDPSPVEIESAIIAGLRAFNAEHIPPSPQKPVAVFVRDETGVAIGGLEGVLRWGWLYVNHVWIPQSLRGTGVGSELLERAEALARDHGCIGCYLDTFDFQALPFYLKHGFERFGTLEGFPTGSRRHYLFKRFDG